MSNKSQLQVVRQKQYVSIKDAATILGVSRCTLYRLVESHELPSYRISERRIVINLMELDDFMQARRTVPVCSENGRERL